MNPPSSADKRPTLTKLLQSLILYTLEMKIISLNIEGYRHSKTVVNFLKKEDADVICLMECPEGFVNKVRSLGYQTTFQASRLIDRDDYLTIEGNLIATKVSHTANQYYYHKHPTKLEIEKYDDKLERHNTHQGLILVSFNHKNEEYQVGTTHFTWTKNGSVPGKGQREDMLSFLKLIKTFPAHVMCGDFNIPRHENPLYDQLTQNYIDSVPTEYTSSLDRNLHKLGSNPEKEVLFNDYMVDYIFTQSPYEARHVRLEFGVSDHAAIIADIFKN